MTTQIFLNSVRSFALFLGLIALTLTSCNKYDDDITNLQGQITANEKAIKDLESLVGDGKWITSVEKTAEGLKFIMNNGDPIILDGFGGQQVAIDSEGYWTIDGERSVPPVKAQGPQGEVGPAGESGSSSPDVDKATQIINGTWHVWDIDLKKFVDTKVNASPSYVTVDDNGQITVKYADENGVYNTITLPTAAGGAVTSITYIPTLLINGVEVEQFNVVTRDGGAGKFTGLSSVEEIKYHVNPINVDIDNFDWEFLNNVAVVKTRSAYPTGLLFPSEKSYSNGIATFGSRMNYAASLRNTLTKEEDIFALASLPKSTEAGEIASQVISRYVVAEPRFRIAYDQVGVGNKQKYDLDAALVSTIDTYDYFAGVAPGNTAPAKVVDYTLTTNNPFVTFAYDGQLDLRTVVMGSGDTHTDGNFAGGDGPRAFFQDLNIKGYTYRFSLPSSFIGDDAKMTNQQEFVELTGSVIKVGSNFATSAIDRTPLVKVELLSDNVFGPIEVIDTKYIILKIVAEDIVRPELPVSVAHGNFNYLDVYPKYSPLLPTAILDMGWEQMNQDVYDALGINHEKFIEIYGIDGGNNMPVVTTPITEQGYVGTITAIDGTFEKDTYLYTVSLNPAIMWRDAEYKWTVTINPIDANSAWKPVVITHTFNIVAPTMNTTFHPIYVVNDIQETKGRVLTSTTDKYEMSVDIAEAFLQKLGNPAHENKYNVNNYPALTDNVKGVKYYFDFQNPAQTGAVILDAAYATDITGIGEGTTDFPLYRETEKMVVTVPLRDKALDFPVQFEEQYQNGQYISTDWTIRFINPLVITIEELEIQTADNVMYLEVKDKVEVKFNGTVIYKNGLQVDLGDGRGPLCDFYGVQLPLTYSLERTNLVNPGSTLEIDANGKISWNNDGTDPQANFHGADIKINTSAEYAVIVPGAATKTYAEAIGSEPLTILKK